MIPLAAWVRLSNGLSLTVASGKLAVPVADWVCRTAYGSYDAFEPSVISGSVRVAARVVVAVAVELVALRNIVSMATIDAAAVPVSPETELPVPKTLGVWGGRVIVEVADTAGQKATALDPDITAPFVLERTSEAGGCVK